MNRKFCKFLCIGISPFVLNFSIIFAMENNIEDNITSNSIGNNNENIIKEWLERGKFIVKGGHGRLYRYDDKYPGLILKSGGEGKHWFDIQEYSIASKLKGKKLSENLMYVEDVLNNQNFVYEHIDGVDLSTWCDEHEGKLKLDLDFFIEKWCIGLFNAMEIFKNYNGEYKGDMKRRNIMVRKSGMIPVLVDFGDMDNTSSVRNLAGILLDVMEEFVPRIKGQRRKWDMLHEYLNEISKMTFPSFDVNEFAKISDFKNNLIYQIENVYDFRAKEILNILVNITEELQNNKIKYNFKRPLFANCIFYKDDKIEIRQTSKKEYKDEISLEIIIQKIIYKILDTAKENGMYGSKSRLKLIKNFKKRLFKMNENQILEELKKMIDKK